MKNLKKFNESLESLEKVTIYYGCFNGGDGSVSVSWYLDRETAEEAETSQEEGFGDSCVGSAETFIGSNIHKEAVKNQSEFENDPDRKIVKEMGQMTDPHEMKNWLDNYFIEFDKMYKLGRQERHDRKRHEKEKLKKIITKMGNPSDSNRYYWTSVIREYKV